MRAKFVFKARIFTQGFSKLATPDRNILITSVFDFLQPRFSLLLPVLQYLVRVTNGFVSFVHAKIPTTKAPELLKDFVCLLTVPINFDNSHITQMNFPTITGVSNIVTSPTNVRQSLKCLNRLAIPHTVAHLGIMG